MNHCLPGCPLQRRNQFGLLLVDLVTLAAPTCVALLQVGASLTSLAVLDRQEADVLMLYEMNDWDRFIIRNTKSSKKGSHARLEHVIFFRSKHSVRAAS